MSCKTSNIFRYDSRRATSHVSGYEKIKWPNRYHYGSEILYANHKSFILVRNSPLQVNTLIKALTINRAPVLNLTFHDPQAALEKDLMKLQDNGILRKMEYDVMNPELLKPNPKVRCNTPISIYEMGTAFMVNAVGILMGIVCFLVELCKGRGRKWAHSKSP